MSCAWIFDGLKASPYGVLPRGNLSGKGAALSVRGIEQVASYNWIADDELDHPTVVIPGSPRVLTEWASGGKLDMDDGAILFDADKAGSMLAPMDPMIQAVRHTTNKKTGKDFDFQTMDILTDCNNLQKLYAFCKGDESGMFRIDLERIGKTIVMTRVESFHWMPIEFECYDEHFKEQCTKPKDDLTGGPFLQIVKYKFGEINLMVRYQPDAADMAGVKQKSKAEEEAAKEVNMKDTPAFPDSGIHFIEHGEYGMDYKHRLLVAHPEARGFPTFSYAQLFFSGADRLYLGWYGGDGDFKKPALYGLSDISRLLKPLPFANVAKTHDILNKLCIFMRSCGERIRMSAVWQGGEFLELYERSPSLPTGLTEPVREYLKSQRSDEAAQKLMGPDPDEAEEGTVDGEANDGATEG